MKVLAIDVGGTSVKILATGQKEPRRFPFGPDMDPKMMVQQVKKLAADWQYDVVSIGIPARFLLGHMLFDPHNLAPGWIGFDFKSAFGCPVRMMNDAAMPLKLLSRMYRTPWFRVRNTKPFATNRRGLSTPTRSL